MVDGRRRVRGSRPRAPSASTTRWCPPGTASTYFAHIFSGGYDAGYYSYIWSEVLDADTVEWFKENGGLHPGQRRRVPRPPARVGGRMDPLAAFRAFRGRDALIQPLLDRRGLN